MIRKARQRNKPSKANQNTEVSRKNSVSSTSTLNSFLIEVEYNNDIDASIRKEINSRFNRSKINATYRFPRSPDPLKNLSHNRYRSFNPTKIPMGHTRLISHTPKPTLIKPPKVMKKKKSTFDITEGYSRMISATPVPITITTKVNKIDLPKLRYNFTRTIRIERKFK